jgi:hypothetical protein
VRAVRVEAIEHADDADISELQPRDQRRQVLRAEYALILNEILEDLPAMRPGVFVAPALPSMIDSSG